MSDSKHQNQIDAFCDALWLEYGLSKNTLDAYRRDLGAAAGWLAERGTHLLDATEDDLRAYIHARHDKTKPSTANRRMSTLRRFYRLALRNKQITLDPTLRLASAKQAQRFPKTLSYSDVEALLSAPDTTNSMGLRDRAMLELMYASGLRVSELIGVKSTDISLSDGVVRVVGKGDKERLVPLGEEAANAIELYLTQARAELCAGQARDALFVTSQSAQSSGAMTRQMFWRLIKRYCHQGRHSQSLAAYLAACVCNSPPQSRCGPAGGPAAAGSRRHLDHTDLYPRGARKTKAVA